ncbi:MAG TPA: NAD-dependent epimerase/dehydratase family protein [Steroidobacteraceae bacterium]|nr:NAD-dependent epimerase/dehydratase family protein [Steroidobacteraceae bacterium]
MTEDALPKILITGGSGFIGARLAQLATQLGYRVTVTTAVNNNTERARCDALAKAGIAVIVAPLEEASTLERALAGQDVVIHLAAAQHEAQAPESHFHRVNVEGTQRLLEIASRTGVRRFVHGSTIGVYGQASDGMLDERSPLAPDNPYGRTKAAAEQIVRQGAGKLEYCIIRISETYGPGDMRLLKLFRGIRKGRFLIVGPGTNLHQLIYADDLARGLLAACASGRANGETIVLAGSERISTSEMVAAVGAAVGRNKQLPRAPMWPFVAAASVLESTMTPLGLKPPLHRRRLDFFRKSFSFSTEKAQQLLDFRAQVSFAEGARRTAQWYSANGFL